MRSCAPRARKVEGLNAAVMTMRVEAIASSGAVGALTIRVNPFGPGPTQYDGVLRSLRRL